MPNPRPHALLVAILLGGCAQRDRGADEHLILSRTAEFELPPGFDIGGGSLSEAGQIVAWSRTDGTVWINGVGQGELLAIEGFAEKYRYGPLGAAFTSDTTLEVLGVTDTSFEVVTLDPRRGGAVTSTSRVSGFDTAMKPLSGLFVVGRWVFILGTPNRLMVATPDARQARMIWSLDSTEFRSALPDTLVNIRLLPAAHTRGMLLTLLIV